MKDDKSTENDTEQGIKVVSSNKKSKVPEEQRKAEACFAIANIMANDPDNFGHRFRVVRMNDSSNLIVLVDKNNVMRTYPKDSLHGDILKYLYIEWNSVPGRKILFGKDTKEISDLFTKIGPFVNEDNIKPVGRFGGIEPCWTRLEWPIEPGETPTYDELFARMSDGDTVKTWVGSLFFKQADRSQYMWIYSDGGDGKSSLANVLTKILGIGATSSVIPERGDRFWTSSLVGKRFVCFPDASDAKFVTSDMFKSLTGDESQNVEYKGKTPIMMKLSPKFMFLSNSKPEVTRLSADIRRALIVKLEPATSYTPPREYNAKLWEEAPHFIHECIEQYKQKCSQDEKIEISEDVRRIVEDTIEEAEESFEVIYDKHFKDLRDHIKTSRENLEARGLSWDKVAFSIKNGFFVDAQIMSSVFEQNKIFSNARKREFGNFLRHKYGVIKKRPWQDGQKVTRYYGIQVHTS